VTIQGRKTTDGKSILGILFLAATTGTEIVITASGEMRTSRRRPREPGRGRSRRGRRGSRPRGIVSISAASPQSAGGRPRGPGAPRDRVARNRHRPRARLPAPGNADLPRAPAPCRGRREVARLEAAKDSPTPAQNPGTVDALGEITDTSSTPTASCSRTRWSPEGSKRSSVASGSTPNGRRSHSDELSRFRRSGGRLFRARRSDVYDVIGRLMRNLAERLPEPEKIERVHSPVGQRPSSIPRARLGAHGGARDGSGSHYHTAIIAARSDPASWSSRSDTSGPRSALDLTVARHRRREPDRATFGLPRRRRRQTLKRKLGTPGAAGGDPGRLLRRAPGERGVSRGMLDRKPGGGSVCSAPVVPHAQPGPVPSEESSTASTAAWRADETLVGHRAAFDLSAEQLGEEMGCRSELGARAPGDPVLLKTARSVQGTTPRAPARARTRKREGDVPDGQRRRGAPRGASGRRGSERGAAAGGRSVRTRSSLRRDAGGPLGGGDRRPSGAGGGVFQHRDQRPHPVPDRGRPRETSQVSYLYEPLHPAMLRTLRFVIDSAHAAGSRWECAARWRRTRCWWRFSWASGSTSSR
jgi:hypothetical protein